MQVFKGIFEQAWEKKEKKLGNSIGSNSRKNVPSFIEQNALFSMKIQKFSAYSTL